jgi:hypothetical protein
MPVGLAAPSGLGLYHSGAVAVREAGYVLATLVGLYANPAFLLVSVGASFHVVVLPRYDWFHGGSFLAMYALAPEKFVIMAAVIGGMDNDDAAAYLCLAGTLLDLASVGGLITGLAAGSLPAALVVGYSATLLGGLTFGAIVCLD